MNDEIMAVTLLTLAASGAYFAYWLAWCWALHFIWPGGPEWITRPTFSGFLLTSITGLIISLAIISKVEP